MTALLTEAGFGLVLIVLFVAAWFTGKALGQRLHTKVAAHPQLGVVQGAILALLGLQLGFCFAGAMSRYVDRQDGLVQEANALSTLYLRAELLPDAQRDTVRATLRAYCKDRILLFRWGATHDEAPILMRLEAMQGRIWQAVCDGVEERPAATTVVVPACTDMIDSLFTRNAATVRHIPGLVLIVLVACAVASILSIGLGVERADRRLRLPAAVLVFLIAATLWTIVDLDFPRIGFVRINNGPLEEAARAMGVDVENEVSPRP